MTSLERKKVAVITKYALSNFSYGDWYTLGQITGQLDTINNHPRLLRSLGFGDDDYEGCSTEVLNEIFNSESSTIPDVIDHFDIDLWYQQKEPEKYKRLFQGLGTTNSDFWIDGFLRLFVSHLSSNKGRISAVKARLAHWGISAFLAHEDIEPSREWRNEVEAALDTMDVLCAFVEPGFKESDWCAQEVGYALGRKIDIIPLKAGLDPYGFFGKYQAVSIKQKLPDEVATELVKLLLKKPKFRDKLLRGMGKAFANLQSDSKVTMVTELDGWSVVTDDQMRSLIEAAALSGAEKSQLRNLISRVKAFASLSPANQAIDIDDEIPF